VKELSEASQDLATVVSETDLAANVYEGGLKLWECAVDLCHYLAQHYDSVQPGAHKGQDVLELGCGHGLPAILTLKAGATVDFADYNEEVLRKLTLENVVANVPDSVPDRARFFSGGWQTLSKPLGETAKYDLILTSDTLYSTDSMEPLLKLIVDHLRPPHGVALVAAKTYYFGVGGGTQMFVDMIEKGNVLKATVAQKFTDGSTNVREILEVSFRGEGRGEKRDRTESEGKA